MSQEIFCTSAPKGLKPGSKGGFCTVAATEGMSGPLAEQLERLSGYRSFYPVGHPDQAKNPVSYAHWRIHIGGRTASVLSRVSFAIDYSRRTSRFAHHVVLDPADQSPAGPAWVMLQPGVMETEWTGDPRYIPEGRPIPRGDSAARICTAWQSATGDAAWAGVLAEAFVLDASRPAYILYKPGMNLLPLIDEAIALLPREIRWQVTFNTYFTAVPAGLECTWRCCVVGSDAAKEAQRFATSGVVIDLTQAIGQPRESKYVQRARHGQGLMEPELAGLTSNGSSSPQGARDAIDDSPRSGSASRSLSPKPRQTKPYSMASAGDGVGTGLAHSVLTAETTRSDSVRPHYPTSPWSRLAITILWPLSCVAVGAGVWFLMHGEIVRLQQLAGRAAQTQPIALMGSGDPGSPEVKVKVPLDGDPSSNSNNEIPSSNPVVESIHKDDIRRTDSPHEKRATSAPSETKIVSSDRPSESTKTSTSKTKNETAATPNAPIRTPITVIPFPISIEKGKTTNLVKSLANETVLFQFPNGEGVIELSPFGKLETNKTDRGVELKWTGRDLGQKEVPRVIASIEVSGQALRWKWENEISGGLKKKNAVSSVLRHSLIIVGTGKDRVEFDPLTATVWTMEEDHRVGDAASLPESVVTGLRLSSDTLPLGWKKVNEESLSYESTGLGFQVTLRQGTITSTLLWKELRESLDGNRSKLTSIAKKIVGSEKKLKSGRTTQAEMRILPDDIAADKGIEAQLTQAINDDEAKIKASSGVAPIIVKIIMRNGVPLEAVEIRPAIAP